VFRIAFPPKLNWVNFYEFNFISNVRVKESLESDNLFEFLHPVFWVVCRY